MNEHDHETRSDDDECDLDLLDLVLFLDRLKEVRRENPIASASRRERTAEHSWHLAVSVYLLRQLAEQEIDVEHAVLLAVLHDIPEVFVGDTFVYGDQEESRRRREDTAMRRFLGAKLAASHDMYSLWHEYEHGTSTEARFVKAMDVVLPVILNHSNPRDSSWLRHNVTVAQVLKRIDEVAPHSRRLAK